jgi:hypothetical protein
MRPTAATNRREAAAFEVPSPAITGRSSSGRYRPLELALRHIDQHQVHGPAVSRLGMSASDQGVVILFMALLSFADSTSEPSGSRGNASLPNSTATGAIPLKIRRRIGCFQLGLSLHCARLNEWERCRPATRRFEANGDSTSNRSRIASYQTAQASGLLGHEGEDRTSALAGEEERRGGATRRGPFVWIFWRAAGVVL